MRVRPEIVLAVFVAAVLVAAGVAALVADDRGASRLDPDSPEGVVQMYLLAVLDDDPAGAAALMSATTGCDEWDFASTYHPDAARIVVTGVEGDGEETVVVVDVSELEGNGLFPADEYAHTERFRLQQEVGRWRIAEPSWPLYSCLHGGER